MQPTMMLRSIACAARGHGDRLGQATCLVELDVYGIVIRRDFLDVGTGVTAFVGAKRNRRFHTTQQMVMARADRLFDQFDGILCEMRGFGGDVEIVPAFIGIDDQAGGWRTAMDDGDPLMIIVPGQFQFQQCVAIGCGLTGMAFHQGGCRAKW